MDNIDYSSLPKEQLQYLGMLDENGNLKKEEVSSATQVTAVEPPANLGIVNPAEPSKKKNLENKKKIDDEEKPRESRLAKIKEKLKRESFKHISNEKAIDGVKTVKTDSLTTTEMKSFFKSLKDWRLLKDEGFNVDLVEEDEEVIECVVMDEKGNELIIRYYSDGCLKLENNYVVSPYPEVGTKSHCVQFICFEEKQKENMITEIKYSIMLFIEQCLNSGSEVDIYNESDFSSEEEGDESFFEEKPKKKIKKESNKSLKSHSLKLRLPTKFVRK